MSALPDPRQEAFARAMALERRLSEASGEAGYTGSRKNGRERAKMHHIAARVKALRDAPAPEARTAARGPIAPAPLTPEERARYLPLSDEDWMAEYGNRR